MNNIIFTYFFTPTHLQAQKHLHCSGLPCSYTYPAMEQSRYQLSGFSLSRAVLTKERLLLQVFIYLLSSAPLFGCLRVVVIFFFFPSSVPDIFYLFIILLCPLFPHLCLKSLYWILKALWDLALCATELFLICHIFFLVFPQPFLPLPISLMQLLQLLSITDFCYNAFS